MTLHRIPRAARALGLAALACAAPVLMSADAPAAPLASVQDERLKEWPELEDETAAKKELAKVRKARTPEMAESGAEALIAAGAGCAPLVIEALGKEKNEDARERLVALLEELTGAPHTRLLSPYFEHKSPEVRRWAGLRTAAFPDPELKDAAESTLARLRKAKRTDVADLWPAAMAATAAGSTAGLDLVVARVESDWSDVGRLSRTALEGARGKDAAAWAMRFMEGAERVQLVAGLRLLAGCGDDSSLPVVKKHLASSDNTVRIEAINACRGIVDGEPPLERLSAFDAIEVAKRWQERI